MAVDSTIRYWFVYLTEFLNLKFTLGRWDEIKDKTWQKYAYAESKKLNISFSWALLLHYYFLVSRQDEILLILY
jgi:hypothetical protein